MILFDNVSYKYPFQESNAVTDISFELLAGKITLITGASGSGKSTIIRLANGLAPNYYKGEISGRISINNLSTQDHSISEISREIGTLFQDPENQFFALNVEDELAFALECQGVAPAEIRSKINITSQKFKIKDLLSSSIHELSEGQKQKIGLASIFLQNPKSIILDEPTANLDPEATIDLANKLLELKNEGIAILIVDHRLYWLEEIVDNVIVMQDGYIVERGDFSLLKDSEIRARYGLRSAAVEDSRTGLIDCNNSTCPTTLSVSNLTFAWKNKAPIFKDSIFKLPTGITAIIGDNGVGKTTLARILTGLNKTQSGSFYLDGKEITTSTLLSKSALVLQNTDHQLYMKTVLAEVESAIALANRSLSKDERREKAISILSIFLLESLINRHPQSLSGGEKQRLVISVAFAKDPTILILDEPTSGLDGKNMLRIATALNGLADKCVTILLITHDLELISLICKQALRLPLIESKKIKK